MSVYNGKLLGVDFNVDIEQQGTNKWLFKAYISFGLLTSIGFDAVVTPHARVDARSPIIPIIMSMLRMKKASE